MKHFIITFVSSLTYLVYFKFCISFKLTKIFLGMAVHAMPRQNWKQRLCKQSAKKVVSDSPGLVDFAIGSVNPGLDLPKGQLMFFWDIQITEEL